MKTIFTILLMCFTGFTLAQDEEATDDAVTSNITAGFIDLAEGPEEEADEGEEGSDETEEETQNDE